MQQQLDAETAAREQQSNHRETQEVGEALYRHVHRAKPKSPRAAPVASKQVSPFTAAAVTLIPSPLQVFLEIAHPSFPERARLVFLLLDDEAPKAAAKFRSLCAGKPSYSGGAFSRINKGSSGDGWYMLGGAPQDEERAEAAPHTAVDEVNSLSFELAGCLATGGVGSRDDQFIVTLAPANQLADKTHCIFGKLVSQEPSDVLSLLMKVYISLTSPCTPPISPCISLLVK